MKLVKGDFVKVLVGQHKGELADVIRKEGNAYIIETTYGAIVKVKSSEIEHTKPA